MLAPRQVLKAVCNVFFLYYSYLCLSESIRVYLLLCACKPTLKYQGNMTTMSDSDND